MRKKLRQQQGVTLMVLIITIIVMLILAGISVNVVVNGGFFDKANKANKMNENAITKSEQDEANALKENYSEFRVDDNFTISGIEMYELVRMEKVVFDSEGKPQVLEDVMDEVLQPIEISLSQYIKEKGKSIYFKADTDRTSLTYKVTVNGSDYNFKYIDYTFEQIEENGLKYELHNAEEASLGKKTTIIKVDNLTQAMLDKLVIAIKDGDAENANDLYSLKFKYNTTGDNKKTIYIPTGVSTYFGSETPTGNVTPIKNFNYQIKNGNEIDEEVYISPKTSITVNGEYTYESEETRINSDGTEITVQKQKFATINEESKTSKTYRVLNPATYSSMQPDATGANYDPLTLYLVQEKDTSNSKTMYLDDYDIEFYNPVHSIELTSPQNLKYVFEGDKTIQYLAKDKNGQTADVEQSTFKVEADPFEKNGREMKISKDTVTDTYVIRSSIRNEDINAGDSDEWKIKMHIEDVGGGFVDEEAIITVASNRFRIFETGRTAPFPENEEEIEADPYYFEENTLKDAIATAKNFPGNKVTIQQIVSKYNIEYTETDSEDGLEDGLYGLYKKETDENGKEKYYFDFGNINDLTYDLNGNTLNLKDYASIKIPEGKTFNLISSCGDNETYNATNAGSINFNHPTTFVADTVAKNASQEDFLSRPKYKKFESLDSYLKANGRNVNWFTKLIYWDQYLSDRLDAYMEYIHSFNQLAYNVKYSESFSGIINCGTFNFKSGNIIVNTDEQVMSMGMIGGEVIFNTIDVFLEFLNKIGIKTTNLSQLLLTYAQIENTGVGIENHGRLNLGEEVRDESTGDVETGIFEDTFTHPEILVNVHSRETSLSISKGTLKNPNKVISKSYGVWNASDNSVTNMYSGFMSLLLSNNTNSSWEIFSIGNTYGIFNEKGQSNIYGITEKEIDKNSYIYEFMKGKFSNNTLENYIKNETYYGFLTNAQLQLVDEMFGLYVYYTNSYAIASLNNNYYIADDVITEVDLKNKKTKKGEGYQNNVCQTVNFIFKEDEILSTIFNILDVSLPKEIIGTQNINRMKAGWIGDEKSINKELDSLMDKVFE